MTFPILESHMRLSAPLALFVRSLVIWALSCGCVSGSGWGPAPGWADVLFVHECHATEFLLGEWEASQYIAITPAGMFMDKQIRHTGQLMKRFFGKVTESRNTANILLPEAEIREIDWEREQVNIFAFERLKDVSWLKTEQAHQEKLDELLSARYKVLEPIFSVSMLPGRENVAGYDCTRVETSLHLETVDLKKNAASITLISQTLWLAHDVPGTDEYRTFYSQMGALLGLEAERLGNLAFLLRYWHAPLKDIETELNLAQGYPVKRSSRVEVRYEDRRNLAAPHVSSRIIKEEFSTLERVVYNQTDLKRFTAPSHFRMNPVPVGQKTKW